jgi:hypothetical protein
MRALRVSMRRIWVTLLLAAGTLLAACSTAPNVGARFPHEKITPTQWSRLYEETRESDDADIAYRGQQAILVRVSIDPPTAEWESVTTSYVFTLPGHPAHPAVVIFESHIGPSTHYGMREAYYAGKKQAFEAWLNNFNFNEFSMRIPE